LKFSFFLWGCGMKKCEKAKAKAATVLISTWDRRNFYCTGISPPRFVVIKSLKGRTSICHLFLSLSMSASSFLSFFFLFPSFLCLHVYF
jgi:hypothetical protein